MKTTFSYYTVLVVLAGVIFFNSCNDDSAGGISIYMPQGNKPVTNTFEITDEPYQVAYTAAFAGSDYPTVPDRRASSDITVTFTAEPSLVDAYNQSTGSDYEALPEGSYTFETTATIAKGEFSTPSLKLSINGKDKMVPFKAYLLPMSITQVTGAELSDVQQTTYFVLTGTSSLDELEPFDRSQVGSPGTELEFAL